MKTKSEGEIAPEMASAHEIIEADVVAMRQMSRWRGKMSSLSRHSNIKCENISELPAVAELWLKMRAQV